MKRSERERALGAIIGHVAALTDTRRGRPILDHLEEALHKLRPGPRSPSLEPGRSSGSHADPTATTVGDIVLAKEQRIDQALSHAERHLWTARSLTLELIDSATPQDPIVNVRRCRVDGCDQTINSHGRAGRCQRCTWFHRQLHRDPTTAELDRHDRTGRWRITA